MEKTQDDGPPSYKEVTSEFADNTNCNGIANIKRSNHFVRKAFWTLLVLTGAGWLILNFSIYYEFHETCHSVTFYFMKKDS